MIRHVLARFPCSMCVLILCTGAVAARAAAPASGPAGRDTAQIDVGDKQGERPKLPRDLTFRTRVLAITPAHDVKIDWRYGGEAQGGQVYRGTLATVWPSANGRPAHPWRDWPRGLGRPLNKVGGSSRSR